MGRLAEAIAHLTGELRQEVPDFDLGVFVPASPSEVALMAEECAPLNLPVELVEWWAWCGGAAEVAIPSTQGGEFNGETWVVPARRAFDLFRSFDEGQWPIGQAAPHPYGPKNLLEIAGVEAISVFAEIVPRSEVCPVWLGDIEDPIVWPVFASIADFVEVLAAAVSVDPQLESGWRWDTDLYVGGTGIAMDAIHVNLGDRNSYLHPLVQQENADPSVRSIAVPWPSHWIERDR